MYVWVDVCAHMCACMRAGACSCACMVVHVCVHLCMLMLFGASVSVCLCSCAPGVYTPNELHSGIPPLRCKMVILVVHTQ